ncbi:MAG: phosphatidylserine decarboxylase, partial [Methyloceanibacter sp.]
MNETKTLLDSVTNAFVPIHRDGHKFIAIAALITLILFLIAPPLGWIGVIATAFCAYFFRDPDRIVPSRSDVVVSPADGKIAAIAEVVPPRELALG